MADLQIALEGTNNLALDLDSSGQMDLNLGGGSGYAPIRNYELLTNKPQINGVTLMGNKFLADLFPDGIILNGGDSTGYTPPVVPTGVPNAEGVMF